MPINQVQFVQRQEFNKEKTSCPQDDWHNTKSLGKNVWCMTINFFFYPYHEPF